MKTSVNRLEQLKQSFSSKQEEKDYLEMILGMIDEICTIEEKLTAYHHEKEVALSIMRARQEWATYVEVFIEILSEWLLLDFARIKREKHYLDMEDLMADIDDWIESFEEENEETCLHFSYMESWDIGVFLG